MDGGRSFQFVDFRFQFKREGKKRNCEWTLINADKNGQN